MSVPAALVFHGIGVFEVGLFAFLGRLDVLAHRILPLDVAMAELSLPERIAMLQSRLTPIATNSTSAHGRAR